MIRAGDDAALYFEGQLWQTALYDLGNTRVLAQADGCGAISRYAVVDRYNVFVPDSFYVTCSWADRPADSHCPKEVRMLGRTQSIRLEERGAALGVDTFLDDQSEVVYQQACWRNAGETALECRLDFGVLLHAREMAARAGELPHEHVICRACPGGMAFEVSQGVRVYLACSEPLELREIEGAGIHLSVRLQALPREEACLRLAWLWREGEADGAACAALMRGFEVARLEADRYAQWLTQTACGESVLERAESAACRNCAISNYKKAGDPEAGGFAGFFAGVHYQSPARTYYRDSFYTALPLLRDRPEWIKGQLRALVGGIGEDGTCPSAVKSQGVFWPDHLDSPAYFVLLLHAYVGIAGDEAFLRERVRGRSMLEWALLLVDAMRARADASGLLYRRAGNRHDWADNVYREGYVCYEQALYCQALRSLGALLACCSDARAGEYLRGAAAVAEAIERELWLEDKGWYANYRSADCLEDNLSVDTVLLAWFGIARPERARRLLENMEALLETRNNPAQPFGDWGVMCCWPRYRYPRHLVEKSNYPYVYHNGSEWPFWSGVYALAKREAGLEWRYAATRWFAYGLEQGWCTPVEYHNPATGRGSLLQGWSAMGALALEEQAPGWRALWNPDLDKEE